MQAVVQGGINRVWFATSDPDSTVHSSNDVYADQSEFFLNTNSNAIFFCTTGGISGQVWENIAYMSDLPAPLSQSSVTRSLNTAYQPSTTRGCNVFLTVQIATSISLTGGQSGRAIFEIATNSGFTTGVQELTSFKNEQTGTLVIGLTLNQTLAGIVGGFVPAGYYYRVRTVNTTGTPTFTYISGQEILQ